MRSGLSVFARIGPVMGIPYSRRCIPSSRAAIISGAGLVGSRSEPDPPSQDSRVAQAQRHLARQPCAHRGFVAPSTAMIKSATPVGLSATSPTYFLSNPPMLLSLISISSLT